LIYNILRKLEGQSFSKRLTLCRRYPLSIKRHFSYFFIFILNIFASKSFQPLIHHSSLPIMSRFIKISFILFLSLSVNAQGQTFETNLRKAYAVLTVAQERDRQAAEQVDEIKTKRIRAEEDLVDAMEANQLSKKEKTQKENNIKLLKKQEGDATKSRKIAADYLTQVLAIVKADDKKRSKFVVEYEKKNGKIPDETPPLLTDNEPIATPAENNIPINVSPITEPFTPTPSESIAVTEPTQPSKKGKKENKKEAKKDSKKENKKPSKKDNKVVAQNGTKQAIPYDPEKDVAVNPPFDACVLAFDGIDNFTQKKKRETKPMILFKHTEDFMREALKEKDYITCEVSATRVQGSYYSLNLTFNILSKEAQRAFGFLDKGTPIVFKLINGRNLVFYTSKTDIGVLENNLTTYKAQLQISSSDAKLLGQTELDVLRVAWSLGYEDYDIHNMDVMQSIIKCLDAEIK
jgi:hypothetical protein